MVSADGRFVAFRSTAAIWICPASTGDLRRLVMPPPVGSCLDYYVRDRCKVERRHGSGLYAAHPAGQLRRQFPAFTYPTFIAAMSDDGRYVAYDGQNVVYRHDLLTDTTEGVSVVPSNGTLGFGLYSSISPDGRFVSFESTIPFVAGPPSATISMFAISPSPRPSRGPTTSSASAPPANTATIGRRRTALGRRPLRALPEPGVEHRDAAAHQHLPRRTQSGLPELLHPRPRRRRHPPGHGSGGRR